MGNIRHYKTDYRKKLQDTIAALPGHVFTRTDLTTNSSNQEQLRLNRALKAFIEDGSILKISHGLYAKAIKLQLPNGSQITALQDSFEAVAIEALNKLQVKWEFGQAIQAYNRGESSQIPATFAIKLHSRFRGNIAAEGRHVVFEGGINAR